MSTNLINISKKLIDNIDNIDDLIDSYFEPIKDYTDTAQDIFTPIKAIHSLYTFNKKRKFKNFLKAYAVSLNEYNLNNFDNTEKLKRYLKIERNFNFLNDIIENAINAKSVFGSMILGYYAGQILAQNQNIGFKELIILEGLKELNDFELSCFVRIYNVADLSKTVSITQLKEIQGLKFFCQLTIEKLIQLRFIDKDPKIYLGGSNKTINFVSAEPAEEIFFLIKDFAIYNELLNYEL
jgi:hypothetical protein